MTEPAERDVEAACLLTLEGSLDPREMPDLGTYSVKVIDGALSVLVKRHGAAAAPLLHAMVERANTKTARTAARRALYRMTQAGIVASPSPAPPAEPVIKRRAEQPVRAWLSGIDGTGSRAAWILFEGGLGGQLQLCSLILNDEAGILEAAGGSITKKRLEAELGRLREHQKLPWVESDPARACALVTESLALHTRLHTDPPTEFSRWRRFFTDAPVDVAEPEAGDVDQELLGRSAELLEFPELAGWFVDPESIHEDALALLQARESRLVVSDQIRAEREAAIVDGVIDRHLTPDARRRWRRRLMEMALVFRSTGREDTARMAATVGAALADEERVARHIPFMRTLALRGLEMGAEVALGRAKLADVSRSPVRRARA
jgi:hypothetical protein